MTLNEIAHAIDMQILRMQRIRAIVVTLLPSETMQITEPAIEALQLESPKLPLLDSSSPDSTHVVAPVLKPRPRRSPGPRRRMLGKVQRLHAQGRELPASALGGAVPQGPVVVSAADVVRSRNIAETSSPQASTSAPSQPGHSLEDLVRQLTQRSGSDRSTNNSSS